LLGKPDFEAEKNRVFTEKTPFSSLIFGFFVDFTCFGAHFYPIFQYAPPPPKTSPKMGKNRRYTAWGS